MPGVEIQHWDDLTLKVMLAKTRSFPSQTCLSLEWGPGTAFWKAPGVIQRCSQVWGGCHCPTLCSPTLNDWSYCCFPATRAVVKPEPEPRPACPPLLGWRRSSTPQRLLPFLLDTTLFHESSTTTAGDRWKPEGTGSLFQEQ